jgi:hypothetical protein
LEFLSTANNSSTGLPYNYYENYYDTQVSWNDIADYINDIKKLYYAVNMNVVKNKVRTKFNSLNNGQPISFRYQLGAVLNELLLNLPADDPTTAVSTAFGCAAAVTVDTTTVCGVPQNLFADRLQSDRVQLHWTATAPQYNIHYKKTLSVHWLTATKTDNFLNAYYLEPCQTYRFKVKSMCSGNRESAFSAEGTFQLPCSGIAPLNQNVTRSFEIVPNPSDLLQISVELESGSEQNTLEIGNLQGQILKTIPIGNMPKGFFNMKIPESNDLEAGLYWITLKTNQTQFVKKWLKQ